MPSELSCKPLVLALAIAAASFSLVIPYGAAAQSANQTQQETMTLDITAGSLTSALNELARTASVALSYEPSLTANKMTQGIEGSYTIENALKELLAGTGLVAVFEGDDAYVIEAGSTSTSSNNGVAELAPAVVNSEVSNGATGVSAFYNKDELDTIQAFDLKNIFANESSISVGGSIPLNQKLYLRGIEETALLVTIDGARQNNKIFHHSATTLIDPSLLKSVRASAGVAPADAGPGALGGSIAFETIDVSDVLQSGDHTGGFVKGSYDSNNDAVTTAAAFYAQNDGFEVLGFLNNVDGDDYEDGNGNIVKYTEAALFSGLAKVAYETGSGNRFELSYESVNDNSARPYRANFSGLTAGRPTPESRIYDLTRNNLIFNYSNQSSTGLWNPKVLIAQSQSELDTIEIPLSAPDTSITYNGITESTSGTLENLFFTNFADRSEGHKKVATG